MTDAFPNITRAYSQQHVEYVRSELEMVPLPLRRLVADAGFSWYVLDAGMTGQFVGLGGDVGADGRSASTTSHVNHRNRRIVLYGVRSRDEGFSIIHHEFAHVLDDALGRVSRHLAFAGTPLDWYAATDPAERFAQAFTAYLTPDRAECPWYAVHTQEQLRKQEPDLYHYFERIS